MKRTAAFRLVILALGATVLVAPLLLGSFPRGPDIGMHIFATQRVADEWSFGVWYPRWFGDYFAGYGAPFGVLYPPLMYASAAALMLGGLTAVTALKVVLWLSVFASGLFLYQLSSRFMRPGAALIAGLVYQAAPYRIIDLYDRTAFLECLVFAVLPLLVDATFCCATRRRAHDFAFLALAVSFLIFTHLLLAYLFLLLFPVFVAAAALSAGTKWKSVFFSLCAGIVAGVMVSAVYWLPAFLESSYAFTGWLTKLRPGFFPPRQEWGNYLNNFLFEAHAYKLRGDSSMYSQNVIIGITALANLLLAALSMWIISRTVGARTDTARVTPERAITLAMGVTVAVTSFMSFSASKPLWLLLPQAAAVQFPWRWQISTSFAVAFLVGKALHESEGHRHWRKIFPVCTALYVLCSAVLLFRFSDRERLTPLIEAQLTGKAALPRTLYAWVWDDFARPKWSAEFDYAAEPVTERNRIRAEPGRVANVIEWRSALRKFNLSSTVPATVTVRSFYFPGWNVTVNGVPVNAVAAKGTGLITFSVPSGSSHVVMAFTNTLPRAAGLVLSLCGVATVLAGVLARRS